MSDARNVMYEKDVIDIASDVVQSKLDLVGGDPNKISAVFRPIAFLLTVQGTIDNGGFRYIFENDFRFSPPYSDFVDAYRQIGATDAADCLEKAVALFPFENPHLDAEARNQYMDSLAETDLMFQLGDMVCGDERVWELLKAYVVSNHDVFFPPIVN
jgi:hypothetical protein